MVREYLSNSKKSKGGPALFPKLHAVQKTHPIKIGINLTCPCPFNLLRLFHGKQQQQL